tara:strand:+ start:1213 stop:2226 length:1014 start_codon:yes stop_codon:yes gene_type:complete
MKILVLGGLGFIGTNFINKLIQKKHFEILNIDKISIPSNSYLTKNIKGKYKFIKLDITNFNKLLKVFLDFKPNSVINFAAETHVDNSILSSKDFIYSNIIGTYNLLECTKIFLNKDINKSFKFIQISTDEVFGDLGRNSSNNKSFKENSKYDPSSPYSASKASGDFLVSSWIKTYDLPAIITNISNNYGPYQFEEKLIPLSIKKILNKKKIPIYGDGNQKRDWIYVDDTIDALIQILKKAKRGTKYVIGTGQTVTNNMVIKKIYKNICKILPNNFYSKNFNDNFTFVKDRLGHDQHYKIDSSKIKNELNWVPEISLDKGLELTCNWYISNKNWFNER